MRRSKHSPVVLAISLLAILVLGSGAAFATGPTIAITVRDVTTGKQITNGEIVTGNDQFQVTVTVTNNVNCAGQYVVTAVGAPPNPPEVLVQYVPFIIGPAVGSNSVTGGVLTDNPPNVWEISASCNGAHSSGFGFSRFRFTAAQ